MLPNTFIGEVTTICDISKPSGVAVTASGSILVSSPNKITKLTQRGYPSFHFPPPFPFPFPFTFPFPLPPPPPLSSSRSVIHKCLDTGGYDLENFVGNVKAGGTDGKPFECLFNNPSGIVIDESANLCFVVDQSSSRVRKISLIPWQIVFFNM